MPSQAQLRREAVRNDRLVTGIKVMGALQEMDLQERKFDADQAYRAGQLEREREQLELNQALGASQIATQKDQIRSQTQKERDRAGLLTELSQFDPTSPTAADRIREVQGRFPAAAEDKATADRLMVEVGRVERFQAEENKLKETFGEGYLRDKEGKVDYVGTQARNARVTAERETIQKEWDLSEHDAYKALLNNPGGGIAPDVAFRQVERSREAQKLLFDAGVPTSEWKKYSYVVPGNTTVANGDEVLVPRIFDITKVKADGHDRTAQINRSRRAVSEVEAKGLDQETDTYKTVLDKLPANFSETNPEAFKALSDALLKSSAASREKALNNATLVPGTSDTTSQPLKDARDRATQSLAPDAAGAGAAQNPRTKKFF